MKSTSRLKDKYILIWEEGDKRKLLNRKKYIINILWFVCM